MKYSLLSLLTLSCAMHGMDKLDQVKLLMAQNLLVVDLRGLEKSLCCELTDLCVAPYSYCGIVRKKDAPKAHLGDPPALARLATAYKFGLESLEDESQDDEYSTGHLAVIVDSIRRVETIIKNATYHLRGPVADISRSSWMHEILLRAIDRRPNPMIAVLALQNMSRFSQKILTHFPQHMRRDAAGTCYPHESFKFKVQSEPPAS